MDPNTMYLPENVKKNYKHYTDDQLAVGMTIPAVATELLKLVSQMDDRQLRIVFPFMEEAQIKKVIPQLQLQQQGIAVQVMSPQQIRYCVAAIPSGDRSLLLQNITLILQADSRMLKSDEIQSFIGFIDPLAMGRHYSNFFSISENNFRSFKLTFNYKFARPNINYTYKLNTIIFFQS
jgi:hypothetical protein